MMVFNSKIFKNYFYDKDYYNFVINLFGIFKLINILKIEYETVSLENVN